MPQIIPGDNVEPWVAQIQSLQNLRNLRNLGDIDILILLCGLIGSVVYLTIMCVPLRRR